MSYIDLEDEDLIQADENEPETADLYSDGLELEEKNENNQDANNTDDNTTVSNVKKDPQKKRIIRKPQPKLDYERLRGPKGLTVLPTCFAGITFKGKGHEKEDLDAVMCRLEQWTHRLFPKFTFGDTLRKIETLGHKSQVMNYVRRIRLDMVDENASDNVNAEIVDQEEPQVDLFDTLLNQSTPNTLTPLPLAQASQIKLTDEQRDRMIRNRLLAEERRLARIKAQEESAAREMDTEATVFWIDFAFESPF